MKPLDIRSQINDVAERFRAQYPNSREDQYTELLKLDKKTATEQDVALIIGNGSWVGAEICGECGIKSESIIQIGEEPDYESRTAYICLQCIIKAKNILEAMNEKAESKSEGN